MLNPVPGPVRRLIEAVVRTALPIGNPPAVVAVRVALAVGVWVAVPPGVVAVGVAVIVRVDVAVLVVVEVLVGVAVPTSVTYSDATQPSP